MRTLLLAIMLMVAAGDQVRASDAPATPVTETGLDTPGDDDCPASTKSVEHLMGVVDATYEAALAGTFVVAKPPGLVDVPSAEGQYTVTVNGVVWVRDGLVLPSPASSWPGDAPTEPTRRAITGAMRAQTACVNAGDGLRWLSLFSDAGLANYVATFCCTRGDGAGARGRVLLPRDEVLKVLTQPAPPRTGVHRYLAPDVLDVRLISADYAAVVLQPGISVGEWRSGQEYGVTFPRSPQLWLLGRSGDAWELIGLLGLSGLAEVPAAPEAGA